MVYMKQKGFLLFLICALMLGIIGVHAETYMPIKVSMELSKSNFTGVDDVTVSIRISNVGDDRMPGPVYLHYPDGRAVADFGDGGAVMLDIGETKTWKGTWRVTQKQLESGRISFLVKYPVPDDQGNINYKSKYYSNAIKFNGAAPGLKVTRVISPTMARKDQKVTITYDLTNTGNVALTNIKVTENKSISTKAFTIESLAANESKQAKFEVTMGSKNLTSGATVTYKASGSNETLKQTQEAATIALGEANLSATLAASASGVNIGETVKLTLTLKNEGTISYGNLKVTDIGLGEVFSNQELAAGQTKTLEKEVTMIANGEYAFTILASDNTGSEVSVTTDKVTVNAVDPNKKLVLTVNATADKLEVYSQPAMVRFEVAVTNASEVEAKDVVVRHGGTALYTFTTIKPGETRKLTRDTSISIAGKFQFTATCKDLLGNDATFESNIIPISYSVPTPEPTTVPQRTPPPLQTEPIPKTAGLPAAFTTAKGVTYALFVVSLLLLGGSLVLMMFAFSKRVAQRRQSESALDHLERGVRRDYTTPSENEDMQELPMIYREDGGEDQGPDSDPLRMLQDEEMPHMKYVRGEHLKDSDPASPDQDQDDLPKAEEAYRELTEEEAAILSGGTGHYRLARLSKTGTDDDQPVIADSYSRRRRTTRTGADDKSAEV